MASSSPPCVGSLISAFSHTLLSDALLIPPLHTNSALMGFKFVLVSHHPGTAIPCIQHRNRVSHQWSRTGAPTQLPTGGFPLSGADTWRICGKRHPFPFITSSPRPCGSLRVFRVRLPLFEGSRRTSTDWCNSFTSPP